MITRIIYAQERRRRREGGKLEHKKYRKKSHKHKEHQTWPLVIIAHKKEIDIYAAIDHSFLFEFPSETLLENTRI